MWAALMLMVGVAMAGAWACYLTRSHLKAIADDQRRRLEPWGTGDAALAR